MQDDSSTITPRACDPIDGQAAGPINDLVCRRIRRSRAKRNWTLERLASLSGVSRSMLSQIERGGANPTLAVAHRIAIALGMSLSDLVDTQSPRRPIQVIRGNDSAHLFRDDANCRIRTLSPLDLEKDVEFYELMLKPGKSLVSSAHFEGTREFLTVVKGQVMVHSADDQQRLAGGDSAHYSADVAHRIENLGRGSATAFLVVTYAGGGRGP